MASQVDLTIEQGADFTIVATLLDSNGDAVDLSDVQFISSQFRSSYYSNTAYEIGASVVGTTTGKVQLTYAGASSAAVRPGTYVYDVLATQTGGDKSRLMFGRVFLTPYVTR